MQAPNRVNAELASGGYALTEQRLAGLAVLVPTPIIEQATWKLRAADD